MAEKLRSTDVDLLPVWQRVAWIAAFWALSVATIALLTWALRSLLS